MESTAQKTLTAKPPHKVLLERLVVPVSHAALQWNEQTQQLESGAEVFPVVDGIPVMMRNNTTENDHYRSHYVFDSEYNDYFEEREDPATAHDELRVYQTILKHIPAQTQSVLDVGCGRAWVARELCPKGVFVCSMDISPVNPQKALKKYPYANHAGLVADAFELPFADGAWDCIIASEIIEHVPNPKAFVEELLRVLKPGGTLVLSTPYKERLKYSVCIHCNKPTPLHAHIHSFDEHVLTNLAPLPNVRVTWESFGNKALLLFRTYVLLQWLPYTVWRWVDALANVLLNKRAHIVVVWNKLTTK
ncbi:MAG: methyltransferase domain-containing protein [Candidatus Kapaibacterium sp.]